MSEGERKRAGEERIAGITTGSFAPVSWSRDGAEWFPESPAQMWCLPSGAEMAALDAQAIKGGVSGLELMERAGSGIAREVQRRFGREKRVLAVCGPGNNGGDGLVVARVLREAGYHVDAVLVEASRYSEGCLHQLQRIVSRPDPVLVVDRVPDAVVKGLDSGVEKLAVVDRAGLAELVGKADIVLDALLGTGQVRREKMPAEDGERGNAPRGMIAEMVTLLAQERSRRGDLVVVSVDIPTGVCTDTGRAHNPHLCADLTVTIQQIKRGLLQFPARTACGEIAVLPIGIPSPVEGSEFHGVMAQSLPRYRARRPDGHKGTHGHVLVVGGSAAMQGAAILAVLGALRGGAGLVTRVYKRSWGGTRSAPIECMDLLLESDEPYLTERDVAAVCAKIERCDAVVLGPGIGVAQPTHEFVRAVIEHCVRSGTRIVIDADALTILSMQSEVHALGRNTVITPHPGEASRLLGIPTDTIQDDRFEAVRNLAARYQCCALLKGAGTLVAAEGCGYLIPHGTPYMATAGSGDVLAGGIAAMSVASNRMVDAAALGGYLHARAGEAASRQSGGSIIASEIAQHLSACVGEIGV